MPPLSAHRVGSVAEALRHAVDRLRAVGIDTAEADARLLAAHLLDTTPDRLSEYADAEVPAGFAELVARRAERCPAERLTGWAWFRGRRYALTEAVFVPKPETSDVVGRALAALRAQGTEQPVVVDLCTGSGVLAVSIAAEYPGARVHAVDLSPEAVAVARANAAGLPVQVLVGDASTALPELDGTVDLLVANPPYTPVGHTVHAPEVADFDPPLAVWAGQEGLDVIRAVESRARGLLRPGGALLLEHGSHQTRSVPALFDSAHWFEVREHATVNDGCLSAFRRPTTER
ncbi:release factor glutamine methyltransferase [Streptacidiphilus sp. MAP12-33]|uniref:N5-glutamine methyltransferase family protein n=1 Tax=Streptacidiphilus sp. MAP12-33 TaxID=3156266 RepID=UPI0035138C24